MICGCLKERNFEYVKPVRCVFHPHWLRPRRPSREVSHSLNKKILSLPTAPQGAPSAYKIVRMQFYDTPTIILDCESMKK